MDALRTLFRSIELESDSSPNADADRADSGLLDALERVDLDPKGSFHILTVEEDDRLVGYATCLRLAKLDSRRGFLFIDELHVREAHRRRGVASMLLDAAEELAGDLACHGIRLLVRPRNAAARALYASVGYTEHETILCERIVETDPG